MAELTMGPAVLYKQQDGKLLSQTFDDQVLYDAALEAGWKDTPAAFGIETHPSHPSQFTMDALAPVAVTTAVSAEMQEAIAVVLTMHAKHEAMAASLAQLMHRVELLEHPRVTAPAPMPHEDEEAPHVRQRRP